MCIKMTRILSIDPGGKTGIAVLEYGLKRPVELLHCFEIPDALNGFISWHRANKGVFDWDLIVCENFTLRPSVKFPDLSPVYIIGALTALEPNIEIEFQSPSQKHLCDDTRLKKMGLHKPGLGHANDAIRHGIIYLRNKRHMPTLQKGWAEDNEL